MTSKFADYLPLYRLEDIFERQGFEISRATQSVWCGDVADIVEPLYQRMAERVRKSHVVATDDTIMPMLSPGQTQSARMWVYVGDESNPYNVFDFTLNRGRDGPKQFLKEFTQTLLADAYGGYNGVVAGNAITRAGCWSHYPESSIIQSETATMQTGRKEIELNAARTPDKISETVEEREQLWRWPPSFRGDRAKPCSFPKSLKNFTLYLKVGRDVAARGGNRCVAEIITNHRNIHTRLKECNRTTMPHHVWSDMPLTQCRSVLCSQPDILSQ